MSDAVFWISFWTLLILTAAIGGALGRLVGGSVHNRRGRRVMLAQAWVMMPICVVAVLFSLVAIIGVGGLTIFPSFFLLGFFIGLAPWSEIYSHR
jgi:hypothetical protein